MTEEQFIFTSKLKSRLLIIGAVGLLLLLIGIFTTGTGGGHDEGHALNDATSELLAEALPQDHPAEAAEEHAAEAEHATEGNAEAATAEHHEGYSWVQRLWVNLWINNIFFLGLGLLGVFFFAIQYVAQAGWSVGFTRIMMALGNWLPFAFVMLLVVFFLGGHTIFHWTHEGLYVEGGPEYDAIIAGKRGFLNTPFFLIRMVVFFGGWFGMFWMLKKNALAEDINGGTTYWHKMVTISAVFIVFFAVSSSVSAWDWVLSIDTHWFSTMFGWYVFASWFVSALAAITLIAVFLRDAGYLKIVNENHIHDLGKFVFAFSIFWTYIWFSQFLLIYYANIPEETIYFVERWQSDHYVGFFFVNILLNFVAPFLLLMTRDAKRHGIFLKLVCTIVLIGHWLDFYLMMTPGTLKENGAFGFFEIGLAMVYGVGFLFVVLSSLAKSPLIPKNHPMLEESLGHHI